jgi:transcriptional regulator with XRE-family HTH domain
VADSDYPTLGELIRAQREMNEMSMRQFAAMAGISNPYLSQIERGLREPSERVVESIAKSLRMSADALYAQAGMVDDDIISPVVAAIEADPGLSARQRRSLLEIYDAFVAENGGRARRRRRRRSDDAPAS